ncbi:MAG: DUF6382 domain-containing protein [Clostridia bacterium]|nr:DUF6382 domain-containing protein [Clostridia bacterium]
MNNDTIHTFSREFSAGTIKEYEKHMLTTGRCRAFLPMAFVREEETDRAIYNYGGYVSLADAGDFSLLQAIEITEKVLCALLSAGEHLINPSRIQLNLDTVHIDAMTGNVRIAYVPFQNTRVRIQDTIAAFLEQLEGICRGSNSSGYFENLRRFARVNMSVSDMIGQTGLIRREIRLCGLN